MNAHFKRLFKKLFGGGTAELQLTDADDPLEAGLEILASPPGKRSITITFIGWRAGLTALAIIFAVFLTNPAPICVLDEVDAPLDDLNVVRFCDLLRDICNQTDTRPRCYASPNDNGPYGSAFRHYNGTARYLKACFG